MNHLLINIMLNQNLIDALSEKLNKVSPDLFQCEDLNLNIPIYWSEDKNQNINFDTDTLSQIFNDILYILEKHNEETDFDFDN